MSSNNVHLYNLSLLKPGAITKAVYGNFSSTNATEFAVARGNVIEILTPNDQEEDGSGETDGMFTTTLVSKHVFGSIRGLATLRLWGGGEDRDQLILTYDSGAVTILSLQKDINGTGCFSLVVVGRSTFGKTGCRRVVPGQYVACEESDNGGRCFMVCAPEKQKLVFKVGRSDDGLFVTSAPLHVDKPRSITFDCVGIDVYVYFFVFYFLVCDILFFDF